MSGWKASLAKRQNLRGTPALATLGALFLVAASILPVAADAPGAYSEWGAPTAVAAANTAAHDGCPIESPNGKQLYIASTRAGGLGKNDIWVAERANKNVTVGPDDEPGLCDQHRRPGVLPHAARWRLAALRLGSPGVRRNSRPDAARGRHLHHAPAPRRDVEGSCRTLAALRMEPDRISSGGEFGPSLVDDERPGLTCTSRARARPEITISTAVS